MPSISSAPFTQTFRTAASIPQDMRKVMENHPITMNVIEPHYLQSLKQERLGQFWIALRSPEDAQKIEFILSCTETSMGKYPIFITTTLLLSALTTQFLFSRVPLLVNALLEAESSSRVYSVFAPRVISDVFSRLWLETTHIQPIPEPYYDSILSYCTPQTFNNIESPLRGYHFSLELGTPADIPSIASLCYAFAEDSVSPGFFIDEIPTLILSLQAPFTLSIERAFQEASSLVQARQVWVHRLKPLDGSAAEGIASIVAVTRNSKRNATITKVFTNPDWRGKGCAKRLVRHVCKQ